MQQPATRAAVLDGNYRMEGIDYLTFGFDQTCNLSCPSCRTHRIVEKVSASVEKARAVEEKLIDLLPTVRTLHINPAGEMLASKPSRKLLELIDDERCPELRPRHHFQRNPVFRGGMEQVSGHPQQGEIDPRIGRRRPEGDLRETAASRPP